MKKYRFRQVVSVLSMITTRASNSHIPISIAMLALTMAFTLKCLIDRGGKSMEKKVKRLMREIVITTGVELLSA